MESGNYLQFDAFSPDRVVVVLAIEAEEIQPVSEPACFFSEFTLNVWNWTLRIRRHEQRLEAERVYRIFEFCDRFLGRMHRDNRRWRDSIRIVAKSIGAEFVESPAYGSPEIFIVDTRGE